MTNTPAPCPSACARSPTCSDQSPAVFHVNELFDQIIRLSTPSAQRACWHVSLAWRDVVKHVLQTSYQNANSCPAIDYGQLIDRDMQCSQPSEREIAQLVSDVSGYDHRVPTIPSYLFGPARLTQARELPNATFDAISAIMEQDVLSEYEYPSRENGPHGST